MVRPILKYPGSKHRIAPWIVSHFPEIDHYLEPFFGSGTVYFSLQRMPSHVVLNDLDADVVRLFTVIRHRGQELARSIEMTPWSRNEYEASYESSGDDLEDARRFLVRCWQAFGTNLDRRTGWRNIGTTSASTTTLWNDLPSRILAVVEMLKHAEIECRPAIDVIRRYRSPNVLMYVDPPYVLATRAGRMYKHEMSDSDHIELLDQLDLHPGPVVLSGYDSDLYQNRLPHWQCRTFEAYAERGKKRVEVLWLNPILVSRSQLSLF